MAIDRYAVIGNPVAHSESPLIHAAFAQATGQVLTCERLLAPRDGFMGTVERFVREGGKGLNVTIPFKLEAFALARERSARATSAGACNTLAWRGDHWYGDNTDGVGLLRDLIHSWRTTLSTPTPRRHSSPGRPSRARRKPRMDSACSSNRPRKALRSGAVCARRRHRCLR